MEHKETKICFERTTKRGNVPIREIALQEIRREFAERLWNRYCFIEKELPLQEAGIGFQFVANLGYQIIKYDIELKIWKSKNSKEALILHPFVNEKVLNELLIEYRDNIKNDISKSDTYNLLSRAYNSSEHVDIVLCFGLKAYGDNTLGISDYHIRADISLPFMKSKLELGHCQAFSFIEINLENKRQVAKVMSIIKLKRSSYKNKKEKIGFFLVIVILVECEPRPLKTRYYPYKEMMYRRVQNRMLDLRVIPLEAIVGPLFVISTNNTSSYTVETLGNSLNETFYLLGSTRIRNNNNNSPNYDFLSSNYPGTFLSIQKMIEIDDRILPPIVRKKINSDATNNKKDDKDIDTDENSDNDEDKDIQVDEIEQNGDISVSENDDDNESD